MARTAQHVVLNSENKWSVKRTGTTRASRVFDTKAEAVVYAKGVATNQKIDVYVHRKDGMVEEKISVTSPTKSKAKDEKKSSKKTSATSGTRRPSATKGK